MLQVYSPSSPHYNFHCPLHTEMAQSRRTSTTKHTAKQGLTELAESLKNIRQQATSVPAPTTPAKPIRRPPAQRGANDTATHLPNKSYLKDYAAKRENKLFEQPAYDSDPSKTGRSPSTDKPVRSVVSDRVYPGNRTLMIISLPMEEVKKSDPCLKKMISSESFDDLESTTMGDFCFLNDGSSHDLGGKY